MVTEEMYAEGWSPKALFDKGVPAEHQALCDALRHRQAVFKAELDKGVTPDAFAKGQAVLGAYEAALHGLDAVWWKRRGGA